MDNVNVSGRRRRLAGEYKEAKPASIWPVQRMVPLLCTKVDHDALLPDGLCKLLAQTQH